MTTEHKIIGEISLLTIAILIVSVFIFSSDSKKQSIHDDQIITRKGLHWHPRLAIYIKGKKQEIPANVGISAVHQEIHTHEDIKDDIIHMEMAGLVTKDETRLGNFFRIWGKEFSSKKLFDKVTGQEGTLKMLVNGKENKEFEKYQMRDSDKIEIRYD